MRDFVTAFALAGRIGPALEDDAEFNDLLTQSTFPASVDVGPGPATVYVKDYLRPGDPWILLGSAPLDSVRIPATYLRWRIERPGREPVERAALDAYFRKGLRFELPTEDPSDGMLHVSGDALNPAAPRRMKLEPYLLDRFEVSNQEYAAFVEAGGYRMAALWSAADAHASKDGVAAAWRTFTDRTGQPGPSSWSAGTYPPGEEHHPVGGLSWYEADAYCRWAGKELPTVYHWYGAGGYHGYSSVLSLANFSTHGPVPVGSVGAIGPYGHHDLAGNVREWVANEVAGRRYALGGAWDSPQYLFWQPDAVVPDDRSSRNGVRCADLSVASDHASRQAIRPRKARVPRVPVGDLEFRAYRSQFAYDAAPLNPVVDSVSWANPRWRREVVSFDAAYGGERVSAHLFLPAGAQGPLPAVLFHPGADASRLSSSADLHTWWFDFVVRSGRAVIVPIYKGTYERSVPLSGPKDVRDQLVQRAKDLARTVDYLEQRGDIDASRVGYFGFSEGGTLAPIFAGIDDRIATAVVLSGGLPGPGLEPGVDPINFLPRAMSPLLMIGGEFDFVFPPERSQRPFFEAWGAPADQKRFVSLQEGHAPTNFRPRGGRNPGLAGPDSTGPNLGRRLGRRSAAVRCGGHPDPADRVARDPAPVLPSFRHDDRRVPPRLVDVVPSPNLGAVGQSPRDLGDQMVLALPSQRPPEHQASGRVGHPGNAVAVLVPGGAPCGSGPRTDRRRRPRTRRR